MKLPSTYEAGQYEKAVYDLWDKRRAFVADPHSQKERFSISMPPPNETGTLHVGHALFITLQDIMARHSRQQGKDVLWLPGTDHAAIATNAIIEKRLAEQGTDKHAIGREEFINQVKEFVGNSRETINGQIKAMGASCDWSRARYTLDDTLNRCVNEVFVKMYQDGLVYRGHRIVNWDPKLETTISDDEVVHKEEKAPFYTLQYGPFQISTARPETKFGDKYVVMHPDDERYSQYQDGDTFEAEWLNGVVTARVIKDEAVDPAFGTGVMTITPWHDRTDFEIAERHGLDREQIIDYQGKLLPIAGDFAGMTIDEARPKIVERLKEKGLLVNIDEDYVHNVALNERGKGVIEPQIMLQWFIDVNRPVIDWKGQQRSLKEIMRAVIDDSDIELIPKRFEKVYFHWIDNLRDWCISRQIWWGHQVPVWYKEGEDQPFVGVTAPNGEGWQQDPDTLDTWFSSSLWTWSTLIDPEVAKDPNLSLKELLERSIDFKTYHPTSVLETGWDILFFWVARMILSTTYTMSATDQPQDKRVPFKAVYLHGLVRTEDGKKMSKSDPDTIIDPMSVIEEFGTDALRLALVSGTGAGNDLRLGKSKIIANRNFCNKLWNIARFTEGVVGDSNRQNPQPQSIADHWILEMLSTSSQVIAERLAAYEFSAAYDYLYHFVWDDLADWYIEASKTQPNHALLAHVLEETLKLAHPFAPFVTETIWQELGWQTDNLLTTQPWPGKQDFDSNQAAQFNALQTVVLEVRWLRSMTGLRPERLFYGGQEGDSQAALISKLSGVKDVRKAADGSASGLKLVWTNADWWLDIDPGSARENLEAKRTDYQKSVDSLKGRLSNSAYIEKAPESLVSETKEQLQEAETKLDQLNKVLEAL